MNELEYPFDASSIIINRKKIKRRLLNSGANFIEKKIAVLGGSTTKSMVQLLELFLLNQGIKPVFYESNYGKFYEDAVFGNEVINNFSPDIVYIYTSNRNITKYPQVMNTENDVDNLLKAESEKFNSIWMKIKERFGCPIIQNNFEMPFFRLMGNMDASDIHGAINFLSRLNLNFYNFAQTHKDFFICDINYLSADYGLKEWSDPFYWHMYKYALNINAMPMLSFNVSNIIKSIFGKNKKGLVLDLDNTLWGGVIGDDGLNNIKIGSETSAGQVYSEFQSYIKKLKSMGVVLCVNSKNDEENALLGLNHPDCILRPDDFTDIKANWEPKSKNFNEIAETLQLLPESLVFVDDNPVERHIVTEQIPGVSAPEIGESHQYIINIDRNGFFETTYLSDDDLKRNSMYRENIQRSKLQASFSDYGEYLDSLEMKATIRAFEPVYMARIAQLTNKSNQFNLTTKRYTQAEIEKISKDNSFITLCGRLKDRFGDNGVVSICIGRMEEDVCHIDLWLMSCRVIKRDMEYAMMDALVKQCQKMKIKEIRGYYYPTVKNGMVKNFYKTMGFENISDDEAGSSWSLMVDGEYTNKNNHIRLEDE